MLCSGYKMEDKFQETVYDYHYEDSDNECCGESSDEDKDFDVDYFLTTEAGRDVLKSKDNSETKIEDKDIKLGGTISNENLLYDADIDKQNQKWMDKKRQQYAGVSGTSKKNTKVHKSDALLSCPACMVTVCVDCQRHDVYKTQFRAMFVMNCHVVCDELLKYEIKNKSKKRRKKEGPGKLVPCDKDGVSATSISTTPVGAHTSEGAHATEGDTISAHASNESNMINASEGRSIGKQGGTEIYNPVRCDCCETELAVYDKHEVYHFHNVLESLP